MLSEASVKTVGYKGWSSVRDRLGKAYVGTCDLRMRVEGQIEGIKMRDKMVLPRYRVGFEDFRIQPQLWGV